VSGPCAGFVSGVKIHILYCVAREMGASSSDNNPLRRDIFKWSNNLAPSRRPASGWAAVAVDGSFDNRSRNTIRLFDPVAREPLWSTEVRAHCVPLHIYSPRSNKFAATIETFGYYPRRDVVIWDLDTGKSNILYQMTAETQVLVRSLVLNHAGTFLLVNFLDRSSLWNIESMTLLFDLEVVLGWRSSSCFSGNDIAIITHCNDSTFSVWETLSGQKLNTFAALQLRSHQSIGAVISSPDGNLCGEYSCNTCAVYDIVSGKRLVTVELPDILTVCMGSNDNLLFALKTRIVGWQISNNMCIFDVAHNRFATQLRPSFAFLSQPCSIRNSSSRSHGPEVLIELDVDTGTELVAHEVPDPAGLRTLYFFGENRVVLM
jgi:hypothetical protein